MQFFWTRKYSADPETAFDFVASVLPCIRGEDVCRRYARLEKIADMAFPDRPSANNAEFHPMHSTLKGCLG